MQKIYARYSTPQKNPLPVHYLKIKDTTILSDQKVDFFKNLKSLSDKYCIAPNTNKCLQSRFQFLS